MREATAQVEDILRRILNRAAMEREITREAVAGQYQTVHGKPPVDAAHVSMLVRQLGSTSSKK
jgi:hypothetical protein